MPEATDIDLIIYSLTVAAGLSLVIERLLELFKHFTDFESKRGDESQRATKVKQTLKDAYKSAQHLKKALLVYKTNKNIDDFVASIEPSQAAVIPQRQIATGGEPMDDEDFEKHSAIKVFPIPEPSLTQVQQRAFLQLAAAGLGIVAAEAFDVRMLGLFFDMFHDRTLTDTLVSGLVIGGGSQPIHVILRFLTTRRVSIGEDLPDKPTQTPTKANKPEASKVATTTKRVIAIEYDGGVDIDKLQSRNFRPANPNKIVYHHTAMHHENSFQAVVDEITKIKKWSTGYHCVIMPNGEVEFFCRWDRVGNHAYGANQESLGIAFHGNFHTKGNDQFTNSNGQFGNQEPTDAQIDAGAKVIALWAHVYGIPLDFSEHVVPHYLVKPTACPGSNFPHQLLHNKIKHYYQTWQTGKAQQEIADYKALPYVYA